MLSWCNFQNFIQNFNCIRSWNIVKVDIFGTRISQKPIIAHLVAHMHVSLRNLVEPCALNSSNCIIYALHCTPVKLSTDSKEAVCATGNSSLFLYLSLFTELQHCNFDLKVCLQVQDFMCNCASFWNQRTIVTNHRSNAVHSRSTFSYHKVYYIINENIHSKFRIDRVPWDSSPKEILKEFWRGCSAWL